MFNYQSYLSYQNIDWTVAIEEIDQIAWLEAKFFDSPKLWWINQRRYLTHFLRNFEEIPLVGLHNKLFRMPGDARMKIQETLEKVINEGCSGLICIIL